MNLHQFRTGALLLAAAVLSASCRTDIPSDVGIDGTGTSTGRDIVSVGRVRSLGAMQVSGVHYDTTGATVTIDGNASVPTAISIGDVVLVQGRIDNVISGNAKAQSIVADHILQGRIDSIDAAGSSFVALGQTVRVRNDTVFSTALAAGLARLSVGDAISVSGFRDFFGSIIATRIERQVAGTVVVFKTTGAVTAATTDGRHFTINGIVVDYGSASWIPSNTADVLQRGAFVEVKGSAPTASGVLVASSVEVKSNHLTAAADSLVHIEGYVTARSLTDPGQLEINGLAVSTSNATQFSGDLSNDASVTVTGEVGASGLVAASSVQAFPGAPPAPAPVPAPTPPSPPAAVPSITVQGRVFNAVSGAMTPDGLDVWGQTSTRGTWYLPAWKQDGTFTVTVPETALVLVSAGKEGYVQPCASMVRASAGLPLEVELIAESAIDSTSPPQPLSAAGATSVTGSIYEMVGGVRQPVVGVEVWFGYLDDFLFGINHARTRTDRNGRYFACRMPSDPLWWGGTQIGVYKEGYEYVTTWPFDTSKSQVFDFELKRR